MSKIGIQVMLNDADYDNLKRIFQEEVDRDHLYCALIALANDIEEEHPLRAEHIRKHIDTIVDTYWRDVAVWKSEALYYAAMNGQGLKDHLESALEADNEWESVDNGLNV